MYSPNRRRCIFVVSLLLLFASSVRYSSGQKTAIIADDVAGGLSDGATATNDDDVTGSVIDLDAGMIPAAADETACGVAEDVNVVDESADGVEAVPPTAPVDGDETSPSSSADDDNATEESRATDDALVVQSGPFVDLLGDLLLSLEMIDETKAQVHQHHTNVALDGKKVVGLYFSADW
jgi:hypothetical protein